MIYTAAFYLLTFIILSTKRSDAIKIVCFLLVLYLGLRYDYMPDYMSYYYMFEDFSRQDYEYLQAIDHVEYGWFILNRLFAPFGYYTFVFVCSAVFGYGVYCLGKSLESYNEQFGNLVFLGFFSAPTLATLSSAQRQFLVAGIFMIAFSYLVYNRVTKFRDVFSLRIFIYFIIIYLCSFLHSSALALLAVPLFSLLPAGNFRVLIISTVLALLVLVFGKTYLPVLLESFIGAHNIYDHLLDESANESVTTSIPILGSISYVIQYLFISFALTNKEINKSESAILYMALFSIILGISALFVPSVNRIGLYLIVFSFMSVGVVCKNIKSEVKSIYVLFMWGWVLWNAIKIFRPHEYSFETYKTIFTPLFGQ